VTNEAKECPLPATKEHSPMPPASSSTPVVRLPASLFTQLLCTLCVVAGALLPTTNARAQCGGGEANWQAGDPLLGVNGTVRALTVWDRDASGPTAPELVVGGNFQLAGEAPTLNIASWNGTRFSPLLDGVGTQPDSVYAMAVYNNELVAAGTFLEAGSVETNAIASFNGSRWDRMGGGVWLDPVGARVYALAVFNNELIVAGLLARAGGQSMRNITRWNGSSWSRMANGLDGAIYALHVHNNELYAAGSFATSDGVPMGRIARWTGSTWTSVGGEGLAAPGSIVFALGTYQGRLVAGGTLPTVNGIGWLNNGVWQAIGGGVASAEGASVRTITVVGSELQVSGAMTSAGGTPVLGTARYTGSQWLPLASGVSGTPLASVRFAGETVVGGSFMLSAGGLPVGRLAAWNGSGWRAIGRGFNDGVYSVVPQGNALLAAGAFETAGDGIAKGVAVQENGTWRQLGSGLQSDDATAVVRTLVSHNNETYAGGNFTRSGSTTGLANLARWTGSQWQSVAGGTNGAVYALLLDASRNTIFAAGSFTRAGSVDALRVARLVSGSWQPMGAGFSSGASIATVQCLALFNNELYAGGNFSASGSTGMLAIARWDGTAWRPVLNASNGLGLASGSSAAQVLAMAVHNNELIVGGTFASAGGEQETRALARWNGTRWARVGPPLETDVFLASVNVSALLSTPDGLIVAGSFTSCAGLPALNIARWHNNAWSALGDGIERLPPLGAIRSLSLSGTTIIASGDILKAGDNASSGVARYSAGSGTQQPPEFGDPIGARTIACGGSVVLWAPLVRSDPSVVKRWRRNGTIVSPGLQPSGSFYSDTDTNGMIITNATPSDSGSWVCEAFNACGTDFSNVIPITVNACTPPTPVCDSIDFNNDTSFPSEQDLLDYLRVLMGGTCSTCNDIDFNNDGLFPDDRDLVSFLRVLAGGSCE
jgi:hypothetical protein